MGTPPYYFGRRGDHDRAGTPADIRFREFHVKCRRCESYRVKVVAQFGEDSGEAALLLLCELCGNREIVKS